MKGSVRPSSIPPGNSEDEDENEDEDERSVAG
jgi:hypothetical protein